jgi:hypothetical protein
VPPNVIPEAKNLLRRVSQKFKLFKFFKLFELFAACAGNPPEHGRLA